MDKSGLIPIRVAAFIFIVVAAVWLTKSTKPTRRVHNQISGYGNKRSLQHRPKPARR